MSKIQKILVFVIASTMGISLCGCQAETENTSEEFDKNYIEETLNLDKNEEQTWTYQSSEDAWVLSAVSAVAYPELPDQQGVSVCVPGAYVKGIDTNGDETADVTSSDGEESVQGALVIDYEAELTSTNGQIYTAATAPVIMNTGAAGYGSQNNQLASTSHAADGYINVSCGNRGKQDSVTDEDGNTYYTGDAPSCLADQKAAARYVKYNILLGNLPGNVDYFVSTGGSGGGAHAAMFAATSNHPDFYDYQIAAGAVGVYKDEDGNYSTTVSIDGVDYEISDGAWGCMAYSPITSLYEADMALAFEYYLDIDYSFGTDFQAQLAEYLSASYMDYINAQNLSVEENAVGFDLNNDGDMEDHIALSIEYDAEGHADTNGYYGTYIDLYIAEFTQNLQWYLDNLDYAEGWTWFDKNGNALSDEAVEAMTTEDKAEAFIEGRYTKNDSQNMKGGMPDGIKGELPDGEMPDKGELPDGEMPDIDRGEFPLGEKTGRNKGERPGEIESDNGIEAGTPDAGTTQSASSGKDSSNYATYEEMVASYAEDIAEIEAGDKYGNNLVDLYNPLNYIGAEDTEDAAWVKVMMGASEGDMSMFSSLNLQIAMLNAGIDTTIEWQWNGGHVPSETLGDSFSLYVDQMYGKYVEGAVAVEKKKAVRQSMNGTATETTGTDISAWVNYENIKDVSIALPDIAAYRTNGASKAMPGFDVIDYGQEDYVFGDSEQDARHWNARLLAVFEEYADTLAPLFNN